MRTATLQEEEHGLTEAALDETDVLLWWGHSAHDAVDDAVVERVKQPFDIPAPDELIFISSFTGGEVFRSSVTFTRGRGRIF